MNATKTRQPTARIVREMLSVFATGGKVAAAPGGRVRVDFTDPEAAGAAVQGIRENGYRIRHAGPLSFFVTA